MRKKGTINGFLMVILSCIIIVNLKSQVIFEGEDAFFSAGKVDSKHPGFTGDGFVDTENAVGVYVEWTFQSPKSFTDTIGFRYALGKDEIRSMQVYVNDILTDTIDFDNTTEFTNYVYKYSDANLVEGENKVKLVALNIEGAPNLDHLAVNADTNLYFYLDTAAIGNGSISVVADSFLYGTRISIEAIAEPGSDFQRWTGDATSSINPLKFTVDKDYSIHAIFASTLNAFPGAEGFAKDITGGRGGAVIEVTNLNNAGSGSLRDAINQTGSRTIVFRVSGTINLESKLSISHGDLTIAGQTAPGDGITLSGYTLTVDADNVIIRYIRSRLGDHEEVDDDAMNGRNNQGVIIDHCTMSWSVDETASFYDNENFTMQYCLISESLYHSVHDKGNHGYGGIWGGKGATFHHNLLAHHTSRNPRFCGSRYSNLPEQEKVDFRNNVIFNWGSNSVYGAEGGSYNIVNNYYKSGPATNSGVRARIIAPNADDGSNNQPSGVWGEFYVDGNYISSNAAVTDDNWIGVNASGINKDDIKSLTEFDFDTVTTHSAEIAFEHVVAQAGVSLPTRDIVDERIIQEVLAGVATYGGYYGEEKGIIDTPDDVGGYPVLEAGVAPVDTDKDGMPDAWETARGLNPNDPEDRNEDDNSNGYTNLEEYLNELVTKTTYIIRPLNFAITSSSDVEVVLGWDDVVEDETAFLLERKGSTGDFEQIAELAANTSSYTDAFGTQDNFTYRLRAINAIDSSYYTDEAHIQYVSGMNNKENEVTWSTVYPNPFTNQISVQIEFESGEDSAEINILNITGQFVYSSQIEILWAGMHELEIDSSALPSGLYMFSVQTSKNNFVKRIIKY